GRRAAGLGEPDEQVGVAHVGDLLLVHVLEEEVLGVRAVVRRAGVDEGQVVGERADVVVVVLRPAGEVVPLQLALGPRAAEGRVLRLAPLHRLLEGGAELLAGQKLGHRFSSWSGPHGGPWTGVVVYCIQSTEVVNRFRRTEGANRDTDRRDRHHANRQRAHARGGRAHARRRRRRGAAAG